MNSNIQLSEISSAFVNYKDNLDKVQTRPLIFHCRKCTSVETNCLLLQSNLFDQKYSQPAIFMQEAVQDLHTLQNKYSSPSDVLIIELQQWQLAQYDQFYKLMIFKFRLISITNYVQQETIPFNPEIHLKQKKSAKIRFNFLDVRDKQDLMNQKQEPEIQKKIKLDNETKCSIQTPNTKEQQLQGRVISKTKIQQIKFNPTEQMINYFKIVIMDAEQILVGLICHQPEEMFKRIQINEIYTFQNGLVTQNDGSKIILFNQSSIIEKSENLKMPLLPEVNLIKILEIQQLKETKVVDLVAVIQQIKISIENFKILYLHDQTGSIKLTLIGPLNETNVFLKGSAIIFKRLKVNVGGIKNSLISIHETVILQNPNIPDQLVQQGVLGLQAWSATLNGSNKIMSDPTYPNEFTLYQLQQLVQKLKWEGNVEQFLSKGISGFITQFKEYQILYPSCPSNYCQFRMDKINDLNIYRCQRCKSETQQPKYSYYLKAIIVDETIQAEVELKDEIARNLIGIPAEKMILLSEKEQRERLIPLTFKQKKIKLKVIVLKQNQPRIPIYQVVDIK